MASQLLEGYLFFGNTTLIVEETVAVSIFMNLKKSDFREQFSKPNKNGCLILVHLDVLIFRQNKIK